MNKNSTHLSRQKKIIIILAVLAIILAAVYYVTKFFHHEELQTVYKLDKDGDEVEAEFADESESASPELAAERNETVKLVRDAISRLPSDQREVVILRDIEGFSYEDIASMLGIEVGTVKSRLNRARLKLRELISDRI